MMLNECEHTTWQLLGAHTLSIGSTAFERYTLSGINEPVFVVLRACTSPQRCEHVDCLKYSGIRPYKYNGEKSFTPLVKHKALKTSMPRVHKFFFAEPAPTAYDMPKLCVFTKYVAKDGSSRSLKPPSYDSEAQYQSLNIVKTHSYAMSNIENFLKLFDEHGWANLTFAAFRYATSYWQDFVFRWSPRISPLAFKAPPLLARYARTQTSNVCPVCLTNKVIGCTLHNTKDALLIRNDPKLLAGFECETMRIARGVQRELPGTLRIIVRPYYAGVDLREWKPLSITPEL